MSESVAAESQVTKGVATTVDSRSVAVMHGRNEPLRRAVFDFLRSLDLHPIEWSEAIVMTGSATPYIGEILDAALQAAQAIVVLMTPDDEARLRPEFLKDEDPSFERELTPQPRPNVLFEAGLALGRAAKRTILAEVGNLRPFSDVAGRHTVRLDNSMPKRQDLANRLEAAGCAVDTTGLDWHTAGNFEVQTAIDEQAGADDDTLAPNEAIGRSSAGELDETEVSILKLIADNYHVAGELTEDQVAIVLQLHPTKAKYYLRKLEKSKWLDGSHLYTQKPSQYFLGQRGRRYSVEKELM